MTRCPLQSPSLPFRSPSSGPPPPMIRFGTVRPVTLIHRRFAPLDANIRKAPVTRDSAADRFGWGAIPASAIAQHCPWGGCPISTRFDAQGGMAGSGFGKVSVAQHRSWGRSALGSVAHRRQWGIMGSVAHAFKWGVGPRFGIAELIATMPLTRAVDHSLIDLRASRQGSSKRRWVGRAA